MGERCSNCNWEYDENDNCDCRPEGYIPPGSEAFLYVNAYEVTRHFGGREEGGWWFNLLEPIASIPIRAESVAGHSDICYTCNLARNGEVDKNTGKPYKLCKWGFHLDANDPKQVEMFKKHLEDLYKDREKGDIYSVNGGTAISIVVEDHVAELYPKERPHYE
jgi:hypothetical protein